MVALLDRLLPATPASASPSAPSPTTSSRPSPSGCGCRGSGRTVWAAAGFVALVAGLLWGARLGVQFSLSLIVLKALPVLVLGGFDSILGAIVGGLVIGASEKLAEVYLGDYFGGGIEGWFAYVVALVPAGPPLRPVRPEARRKGLSRWPPQPAATVAATALGLCAARAARLPSPCCSPSPTASSR